MTRSPAAAPRASPLLRRAAAALLAAGPVAATGCGPGTDGPADLVVVNAAVLTMDPERPRAQAVAVRDGRIARVGTNGDVARLIEEGRTRVIDAAGGTVTPGFNDAHAHLRPVDPDHIDLRYVADPAELTRRVAARAARARPGEPITGGNWDHELFPGAAWPTKALLDSVAPDNPVLLDRIDGHSALANTWLLERSGIRADTPDPPGGEIVRDPGTGEPTGILKESAQRLLDRSLLRVERTPAEAAAFRERGWRAALELAARHGVTSVQLASGDGRLIEDLAALREAEALTVRVYLPGELPETAAELARLDSLRRRFPADGDWLRMGFLKAFIDGTLSSGTALLSAPFADEPGTAGLPQMPYAALERRIALADSAGFQVGIHAIGDRGVSWVLDAIAAARRRHGERDARHRVEHASIIHPRDLPRFAELGAVASTQAVFVRTDNLYAEARLGPERAAWVYPWRSLVEAGAPLAFSTDWPVEPIDPREGLYAALTRKDRRGRPEDGWFPEQRLTLEEAVRAYTAVPAWAEFMEDRKGVLAPGYLADLVVFGADLEALPEPEAVLAAPIRWTLVDGRVVWEAR